MGSILSYMIGCLLFSPLHAEETPSACDGYAIEYEATISASKTWISWDGNDHQRLFMLSDGMRWITNSNQAFQNVSKAGWSVGDHLTLWLTQEGWLAKNHERGSSVPLTPLCNKRPLA